VYTPYVGPFVGLGKKIEALLKTPLDEKHDEKLDINVIEFLLDGID